MKEVICKRWFLKKRIQAITLYPFIFYNGYPTPAIRSHEWIHMEQIHRIGVIKFYVLYLWYSMRKGYWHNPFEVEAYKKQDNG